MTELSETEVLEKQLKQKLFLLENGVAKIANTRNQLKDNADLVRREIRACFGHQLCCLRSREQQLLSTLDTVLTVKDELLSEQQDQLHQAFGACRQGLECMVVAKEDLKKKNSQGSMEAVALNVKDILNKLSSVEIKARETSQISFEADTMFLRRTLHSFGRISTCKTMKVCESLPGDLEDYDEDDGLFHKPLQRQFHFGSLRQSGISAESWLMKEALSGPTSNEMDTSGLMGRRCGEDKEQVKQWLRHIKTQVETEPAVFEDFEISRQRYGSEFNEPVMMEHESKTVEDVDYHKLFGAYFSKILNSPAENWILHEDNVPGHEAMLKPPCTSEKTFDRAGENTMKTITPKDLPANQRNSMLLMAEETVLTPSWLRIFKNVKESSNDRWLSSETYNMDSCDDKDLSSWEEGFDIEKMSSINTRDQL